MYVDASNFPIVRMEMDPALSMPIEEVLACIGKLLAGDQPFVFVGEGFPDDDPRDSNSIEERRQVTLWMKANKAQIRKLIRAQVQIVPNVRHWAGAVSFSVIFEKFWGYPMLVVATAQEAQEKAQSLLSS
ncbi:MAG: hypothetical protein RSG92_04190 [Pseudomonas sp.]